MTLTPPESSKVLDIYLLIAQYPMLASDIRRRMRGELFRRGIITPERFEAEVNEKAVQSQQREGLIGNQKEDADQWELRWTRVRRTLTDFYFAYNLPIEILHHIIDDLLTRQVAGRSVAPDYSLPFNPELAPLEMVLRQAEKYEALPEEKRVSVDHHLQELRVVLLKSMISDQLAFIHIAKRWFTTGDFNTILERRIGTGKVGGKAAGLLLAYKILQNTAPEIFEKIILPRSYYIGADVFYDFQAVNELEYLSQKYKTAEQIRDEYPKIQEQYAAARFPEEVAQTARSSARGGQDAFDRPLFQPAGRQLWHVLCREVHQYLLSESGHHQGKPARPDARHPPHVRERFRPRRADVSPPHGFAGLR